MSRFLDRRFGLAAHGTSVRTEVGAGLTTFLALAYIIFVQPAVLSAAGMDFGAVMTATCLASAVATLLMAWLANYPIAVAPAMGHNFFFAYTVVVGMQVPWQAALGAVAIAGTIFILTAGVGLRERLITALPPFLQHAIAAGIGLLIAMIGLQWSGLVVASPGTLVTLGNLAAPPTLLALFGLVVTAVLFARGARGAILWGMLATTGVGLFLGTQLAGIVMDRFAVDGQFQWRKIWTVPMLIMAAGTLVLATVFQAELPPPEAAPAEAGQAAAVQTVHGAESAT